MQESDRCVSFLKRHTYATRLSEDKNPCSWDEICFKETLRWNEKKQTFSLQGRVKAPC